ncbi:hypothetical protein EPYR_01051 [Erwinia pyrifoliae DSM 12163]|nr:hypothetical protein EPYR_01051 [Erwinia pyrifoliae DSM 12163]
MVNAVSLPALKRTQLNSLSVGLFALINGTANVVQPASRGAVFSSALSGYNQPRVIIQ